MKVEERIGNVLSEVGTGNWRQGLGGRDLGMNRSGPDPEWERNGGKVGCAKGNSEAK